MNRKDFIVKTGLLSAGVLISKEMQAFSLDYPVVRIPMNKRKFSSFAVEKAISKFQKKVSDKELGWLFNNCLPNTLDTTVTFNIENGKPDTYVITGDIDAMWLRDSSAQVWPYLSFMKEDPKLQQLIAGVINRQTSYVLRDPYANAFYNTADQKSEWESDHTQMLPGIHERKWEIDSLCYTMRLAYNYWKITKDNSPFDAEWKSAVKLILSTFKEQQRKTGLGPYKFQRDTPKPTDSLPMAGYGFPIKPNGLICSMFRPSDDATIFPFLIPSNLFALVSLRQVSEMVIALDKDEALATELTALAKEVEIAIQQHAVVTHPVYGKIYAFEVDGFGNVNLMDDANVPSLLALPYLNAVDVNDPVYQNTRKFVLSTNNPFFYKGKTTEGIGGPHVEQQDMIWPLSIIARGLTSIDDQEIKQCIKWLKKSHAGTGFMHESFKMDHPETFTRSWFAWANTIFGEFLWEIFLTKPALLNDL
ncbi:glycoside hydrolase family 125 protein [Pedobacter sp. MC2016-14]|uniref:glycoside hydrolase family 125 protein n=1 Tax=Pedobacter sp. MC2016-14 TaxID=2897327 RepID=UPI001E32E641|nr:glycoside hydrolase family 125 protein [Pedobacter sp. MC2016-14]MCD0488707.1 glycoside hydrolase family 125 protein [Pedobacter sp. MC2016-14]